MRNSDVVSIAATSSGVSGTVTTSIGAQLKKINLAFNQAAAAEIPQIIELTWAGAPQPLRFVPPIVSFVAGTPAGAGNCTLLSDGDGLEIPLDVRMEKADVLTIKITSSGNVTVKVSVEWDA